MVKLLILYNATETLEIYKVFWTISDMMHVYMN